MDSSPEQSSRLNDSVVKWLRTQGTPTEIAAAREFSATDHDVVQSGYYLDLTLQKYREIDIVATRFFDRGPRDIMFGYSFVAECKLSKKKPWVLINAAVSRPTPRFGDAYGKIIASDLAFKLFERQIPKVDYAERGFTFGPERTAFACVAAFKSGRQPDPAFKAMMSCCNAAISDFSSGVRATREVPIQGYCHLWIPLVVLDGVLLEAIPSNTADFQIREVPWGRVLFRQPSAGGRAIVDIVTLAFLGDYVRQAASELRQIIGGVVS